MKKGQKAEQKSHFEGTRAHLYKRNKLQFIKEKGNMYIWQAEGVQPRFLEGPLCIRKIRAPLPIPLYNMFHDEKEADNTI